MNPMATCALQICGGEAGSGLGLGMGETGGRAGFYSIFGRRESCTEYCIPYSVIASSTTTVRSV